MARAEERDRRPGKQDGLVSGDKPDWAVKVDRQVLRVAAVCEQRAAAGHPYRYTR